VRSHLTAVCGIALTLSAGPAVLSEAPGSTAAEFEALLRSLARAWSEQNTPAALACYTPDALYMQPPDRQLYRGRDDLRVLFDGLRVGTQTQFHNIAFAPGPASFSDFVGVEGKAWKWTAKTVR